MKKEIEDRYRISSGDDEEAIQNLIDSIDPLADIDRCVDLVCRFFGNQFTVQEFMDGYKTKSVNDFNLLIEVMTLEAVSGVTNILGEEKKVTDPRFDEAIELITFIKQLYFVLNGKIPVDTRTD